MEAKDLPVFECSIEERKHLFDKAVERHPCSCPSDAWVIVNSEGVCEEGFLAPYATFDEEFLKKNPQFQLCWAQDLWKDGGGEKEK